MDKLTFTNEYVANNGLQVQANTTNDVLALAVCDDAGYPTTHLTKAQAYSLGMSLIHWVASGVLLDCDDLGSDVVLTKRADPR